MPLKNFPFLPLDGVKRPILPIKIINPQTGKEQKTYGIIDTGADSCALPAFIAIDLGHNLSEGQESSSSTVGGDVTTWLHTTTIEICGHNNEVFFKINEAHVEYIENLEHVILGVNDFLCNFRLDIDYPNDQFSIQYSDPLKIKVMTP